MKFALDRDETVEDIARELRAFIEEDVFAGLSDYFEEESIETEEEAAKAGELLARLVLEALDKVRAKLASEISLEQIEGEETQ